MGGETGSSAIVPDQSPSWIARVANPAGRGRSFDAMRASLSRRRGHLALERRHRQRPERQQAIVEGLEAESSPLALGRPPPPARALELADLLRARLAGSRDVAIDPDRRVL